MCIRDRQYIGAKATACVNPLNGRVTSVSYTHLKPSWCIDTQLVSHEGDSAVFCAKILDEEGAMKSSGYGSESKRDFADYLEKAETKAVGRALAMLGYGTQFAPDLDEGNRPCLLYTSRCV